MKIAIDGYEANVNQRLGSSQVAFELLKSFEKLDHVNEYLIYLPDKPLEDLPNERQGWRYKILKPRRFWTKVALPIALYFNKSKHDIIFSPTHYVPRISSIKRIATIFDLSFLKFPETFLKNDLWKLKTGTKYSVENADHLITISNSTKRDIISEYGLKNTQVTVAYPGFNKQIFKPGKNQQVLDKYGIKDSYIIYIGTIQPRKNLIRLMEAVARIDGLQLVLVGKSKGEGKSGWKFEETLETPKRLGIENRVKFTGFVDTEDLPYLLSSALACVQPSLYEGFGIPVLEAMACGTPVIASNVSSLPEIVGNAGLLIDPYSVDQIEQAIRTLVTDKKIRERYSKLGLIQSGRFSWNKMAEIILKVFASV